MLGLPINRDAPPVAAVSPVRPAPRHVLLAVEADAPVASGGRRYLNDRFVDKLHVYASKKEKGRRKPALFIYVIRPEGLLGLMINLTPVSPHPAGPFRPYHP